MPKLKIAKLKQLLSIIICLLLLQISSQPISAEVGDTTIADWKDDKKGAVSILFMDSLPSHIADGRVNEKTLYQYLADLNLTGTFFISPGLFENFDDLEKWYSLNQNHEIANHTGWHKNATSIPAAEKNIKHAYGYIRDIIGSNQLQGFYPPEKTYDDNYDWTYNPNSKEWSFSFTPKWSGDTDITPFTDNELQPLYESYLLKNLAHNRIITELNDLTDIEDDLALIDNSWYKVAFHSINSPTDMNWGTDGSAPTCDSNPDDCTLPISPEKLIHTMKTIQSITKRDDLWQGGYIEIYKYIRERYNMNQTGFASVPFGENGPSSLLIEDGGDDIEPKIVIDPYLQNLRNENNSNLGLYNADADRGAKLFNAVENKTLYNEPLTFKVEVPTDWTTCQIVQGEQSQTIETVSSNEETVRFAIFNAEISYIDNDEDKKITITNVSNTPTATATPTPADNPTPTYTPTPTPTNKPPITEEPEAYSLADFNHDRKVDILDYNFMFRNWNRKPGTNPAFNPVEADFRTDINGDDIVNSLDYVYLYNEWTDFEENDNEEDDLNPTPIQPSITPVSDLKSCGEKCNDNNDCATGLLCQQINSSKVIFSLCAKPEYAKACQKEGTKDACCLPKPGPNTPQPTPSISKKNCGETCTSTLDCKDGLTCVIKALEDQSVGHCAEPQYIGSCLVNASFETCCLGTRTTPAPVEEASPTPTATPQLSPTITPQLENSSRKKPNPWWRRVFNFW